MLISRRKTRVSLDPFILLPMFAMNKSLFTRMHFCKWHIWDRLKFLELRLYPEDSGNSQIPLLCHDSTSQVLPAAYYILLPCILQTKLKFCLNSEPPNTIFDLFCIYLIIAREMLKYTNQFLLTITNVLYPKLPNHCDTVFQQF